VVHGDNMGQGQGPRPQSRQRQGRRSPGEAPWPRIVDNATDTMYPISGWILLLVCVPPSLQPRTPASPPPSGRGSAFPVLHLMLQDPFTVRKHDRMGLQAG